MNLRGSVDPTRPYRLVPYDDDGNALDHAALTDEQRDVLDAANAAEAAREDARLVRVSSSV